MELRFLDGKNLGITKNRIKVEAYYKNQKPQSFTTRIEFNDDQGRLYSIPISGTTDNSLFTSFPYMQRCNKEFSLVLDEESKGPVKLIEDDNEDVNSVDG